MLLRDASIEVVEQLITVLGETAAIYRMDDLGSSIGKHVRHILDHYDALIMECETGLINYNIRSRDSEAETNLRAAKTRIDHILLWLAKVNNIERQVSVCSEVSISHGDALCFRSFFDRELAYVLSHTIHHIAHIRLIAQLYDIRLADDIGVAPATLSYLRNQ